MTVANTLLARPSHRWRILGIGVAANAGFSAAFQGIPTTAVFMRSGYDFTTAEVGLVLGLMGLGIAISELPWGMLVDKWGDRLVLLLGLGGTCASLALMALFASPTENGIPGLLTLAIYMFVLGILGGSVNGASGRAISYWFGEKERGFAMSIRQTAVPLGGGIGAIILPVLASHYGFIAVYGSLSIFCAITFCFTLVWLHEPPFSEKDAAHLPGAISSSVSIKKNPLKDRNVWTTVIAIGILCAPQFAILTFGAIFMHDFCGANIGIIGVTLFIIQLGAIVSRIWSGRWTDKHSNRREYLKFCCAISLLFFCVLAAMSTFVEVNDLNGNGWVIYFSIALVLAGISVSAWHGVAYAELISIVGKERAGTALGMGNSCVFVAYFLTPTSIPLLLGISSWSLVWCVAGICAILSLLLFPSPIRSTAMVKVL